MARKTTGWEKNAESVAKDVIASCWETKHGFNESGKGAIQSGGET